VGSCHVDPASTCTSRDFNERSTQLRSPDHFHPDPYTTSQSAERILHVAILNAEISRSFDQYLEICDEFYADDIEGSNGTMKEPIRGKERVRSLLFSFLARLHAVAEVGGVSISIRETAIPGDANDETHSAWTLELVGVSGKICTVTWRILRKWNESPVVLEHHYDYQFLVAYPMQPGTGRSHLLWYIAVSDLMVADCLHEDY
jgi:hypothetical protein